MTAALELGGQPDLDHALDQLLAQQIAGQTEHVGVVVAATHLGGDAVVTGGRANAEYLVGRDAHADAGAADQDAALHAPLADGLGDLEGEVGVINTVLAGGPHVQHFVPHLLQERNDAPLGLVAAVVAANGDLHSSFAPVKFFSLARAPLGSGTT